MRIACVGTNLAAEFRRMGHEVLDLRPPGGIVDMAAVLDAHGFVPDLLVQQESLGVRVILAGLEQLPCRKAFWAIDSHLNMHWHRHYARLFDVVFTPHLTLFEALPPRWRHPRTIRLAMWGHRQPWKPHAERPSDISLVGVLDRHRPLRGWLAELLRQRFGVEARQGLPFDDMMALYCNSRVIPNESIGFEVNFRLTEGASCGACVLTPDVGPDQNALFDEGREMVVYADGLDLVERLHFLLRRPDIAERMGRAARERVLACHLPEHRAAEVLRVMLDSRPDPAPGLSPGLSPDQAQPPAGNAALGCAGAEAFWLTLGHRAREGKLDIPPDLIDGELRGLPQTPEVVAARIRLAAEREPVRPIAETPQLAGILERLLATGEHAADTTVNMAAAGAALVREDLNTVRTFWYRLHRARNLPAPESPRTIYHACLLWADLLRREQCDAQPGFACDPHRHCPEAAFETLLLAQRFSGGDIEWMRGVERLTSRRKALTFFRLGMLARLALEPGAPWRTQAEYGLACLRAYRVEHGLHELADAGRQAASLGQDKAFLRLLDGHAPGGHLHRALDVRPPKGTPAPTPEGNP